MKQWLSLLVLPALIACSGGDAPNADADVDGVTVDASSPVALADTLIADGNELAALLATVTDEPSARAAEPRIREMALELQARLESFEAMGEPSFSDMSALMSRGPKIIKAQQAIATEAQRIYENHPEARAVLRDSLQELSF